MTFYDAIESVRESAGDWWTCPRVRPVGHRRSEAVVLSIDQNTGAERLGLVQWERIPVHEPGVRLDSPRVLALLSSPEWELLPALSEDFPSRWPCDLITNAL